MATMMAGNDGGGMMGGWDGHGRHGWAVRAGAVTQEGHEVC